MASAEERARIMAEYLAGNDDEEEEVELQDGQEEDDDSDYVASSGEHRTKRQRLIDQEETDSDARPSRPRIRRQLNHRIDSDTETIESSSSDESEVDLETRQNFLRQWYKQDSFAQAKLWHDHGYSMYRLNKEKMKLSTANHRDLVGNYDIVYCHGDPISTDQGWTDKYPVSRRIRGTLTLEWCDPAEDNALYEDRSQILSGTIQVKPSITREYPDNQWEYWLQTNEIVFQESYDGSSFALHRMEGREEDEEGNEQVQISVLENSGMLQWIPQEGDGDNESYGRVLQKQLGRHELLLFDPKESWIVTHLKLPHKVASLIHCFEQQLPKPTLEWKEGDLLLEIHPVEYATSWATCYLARQKGPCRQNQEPVLRMRVRDA